MLIAPTKSNLVSTKKSLALSKVGFELLDRKRNVLVREMMALIERAEEVQAKIGVIYNKAYAALKKANITLGVCEDFALTVPKDTSLNLSFKSVMGIEIPIVTMEEKKNKIPFGFNSTNSELDKAYASFQDVKKWTLIFSEVESSIYLLANAIKKTQKRANALKNVIIPRFDVDIRTISEALEEKEREEFSRLKVIKGNKK